ncbi:MAG: hypothetical protein JW855_01735 [Gammaproteobacteria bacterium]|nr:hypothetical protein [Gammaproteobacteria bacterium]
MKIKSIYKNTICRAPADIFLVAFILSTLLTIIRISFRQPINLDGILYLNTASAYLQNGIKAALLAYPWPFYSILIGVTAKVTSLSVLHAAYLLNFILDTCTVFIFILLTRTLGASRRIQWIGALIISFYPLLNRLKIDVVRDHGYIVFALLGIFLFIKYARTLQWRYAIGWAVSIILASLFRIEGFAFFYFLPLILLFYPAIKFLRRTILLAKSYTVHFILLFLMLFITYYSYSHTISWLSHFGRIPEVIQQTLYGFIISWQVLQSKAIIIKEQILSIYAIQDKFIFIIGGLLAIYIKQIIDMLSLPYALLILYGFVKKLFSGDFAAKATWFWAILINIFVTLIFLSQNFFINVRYLFLLCLLLFLMIPFSLESIYLYWKSTKKFFTAKKWIFPLVLIGIVYASIESVVYFGTSKTYILDASTWINQNFKGKNIILCSNDKQLSFYAEIKNTQNYTIKDEQDLAKFYQKDLDQCQYLAFKIDRQQKTIFENLIKNSKLLLLKTFHNNRGDQTVILRKLI